MLRKIFGPDGDEVAGDWRKLHTEKLHDFHLPPHTLEKLKQSLEQVWIGPEGSRKSRLPYFKAIVGT